MLFLEKPKYCFKKSQTDCRVTGECTVTAEEGKHLKVGFTCDCDPSIEGSHLAGIYSVVESKDGVDVDFGKVCYSDSGEYTISTENAEGKERKKLFWLLTVSHRNTMILLIAVLCMMSISSVV